MTTGAAEGRDPTDARFAAAHRALLDDRATQFDLPAAKRPESTQPPRWLADFFEWLKQQGTAFEILFWVVVAAAAALLLYVVWRRVRHWRLKRDGAAEPEGWRPAAAPARALLAEADALAARGDYNAAAHLVLLRSVEQIAAFRPGSVRPALTSRDIARAPLPADVARAFGQIADVVEVGLFGARPVAEAAWVRCRTAYADVAFPKAWA